MGISDQWFDIYIWRIWSLMTLRWAASSTKAPPSSPRTSHPLWSTANISCLHLSLFSYRSIHLLFNMLPLYPFNHLFPTCTYPTGISSGSWCSKSGAIRCIVLCDGACRPSVANMLFRGYSLHRSGADCIFGNKNESWSFVCSQKKPSKWTVRGCSGGSTVVDA